MGKDQEVSTEGGGVAGHLGNVLSHRTSGSDDVWSVYVGAIGANGADVRGSSYGFPVTGNKVKGKAAEGRVMVEGGGKQSNSRSGDTTDPDLLGQETSKSGGVGGPTAYF